jgi:hypothetical protein
LVPNWEDWVELDFLRAEDFRGTRVLRQRDNLAYAFVTDHAAADADGAPNAYHPDDLGKSPRDPHVGLDALVNAGYPDTDWWRDVLVPDRDDPDVAHRQPSGPTAGFFNAMTALRRAGGDQYDVGTYVDSTRVPYVVIPSGFDRLPNVARQGDVGFATHLASGRTTAFIVGDYGGGGDARLGEGSLALYAALGFPNVNARTGHGLPDTDVQYILFPGSRRAGSARWPRTNEDVAAQVDELLGSTPGIG